MEKIMKVLTSESGMKVVNILFLLSVLIRNSGIIMIAYLCWIFYLVFCIKKAPDKMAKVIYKVFIAFASIMLLINLYFYLKLL